MFRKHAELFLEKGLQVTPLNGKIPYLKDWQNKRDLVEFSGNIGLLTGEPSGVICIDIDHPNPEEIYKLLPPIYCGKKGKKGINYFFKYNGERNEKIHGVVELLSTGNQTVLPPSIHPDTKLPYEWVGRSLLDVDLDDLPDLPSDFMPIVRAMAQKKEVEFIPENGRCVHGSHNKLSEMVVAAIHNGDDFGTIMTNLIAYDEKINPDVSYFECPSRKEWKVKNKYANCAKFISAAMERNNYKPVTVTIGESPIIIPKERSKYPHFRGIAQEIFQDIYRDSPVPRSRFAMASTLALMSITLANRIRIGNIFPNLYIIMVTPSGFGKDYPLKYPKKALAAAGQPHLIGQSNIASDSGLIKTLTNQRERLDTIDEADTLFTNINSDAAYASKIADVYATLYTSCGEYFEGKVLSTNQKTENSGACHSPYVSLISAITPKAFQDSFNSKIIEKGLGARFLYFVDSKYKPTNIRLRKASINPVVTEFINSWRSYDPSHGRSVAILLKEGPHVPEMSIERDAEEELVKIQAEIDAKKATLSDSSKLLPIYNRAFINLVKIAIIDAVSIDHKNVRPILKKDSVLWAKSFFDVYVEEMSEFIETNVSASHHEKMVNKVLESISFSGTTKTELWKSTRSIPKQVRDSILSELQDVGQIIIEKRQNSDKPTMTIRRIT